MLSSHRSCTLLPVLVMLLFLGNGPSANAQTLEPEWNLGFGDANAQRVNSVAVDDVGNTTIVGHFTGSVNFGGATLVSAGGYDVFVAKFLSDGTHLWSASFGSAQDQIAFDVDVDDAGSMYVTGYFQNTISFGGPTHTSAGDYDAFLVKFAPNGAFYWSHSYGAADNQVARGVCARNTNKVYITGYFRDTVDFGGGPLTSAGSYDIFLAQLSPGTGAHLWSRGFGDQSLQLGQRVVANNVGELVITGSAQGTVDFGGGPLTSAGGSDLFVARFNSFAQHIWSAMFGDGLEQEGIDVAFHPADRSIVVAGRFTSTINLGGATLVSGGDYDTCLGKFDHNGSHVWSLSCGGPLWTAPAGVHIGSVTSRVALTGEFEGTADFGGGPLTSAGGRDVFVAVYDMHGSHVLSQAFGDASGQYGKDVAYDDDEELRLIGDFTGTIDLGLGPLTSSGDRDVFLANMVEAGSGLAEVRALSGLALRAWPNPFDGVTTVTCRLPQAGWVRLSVHDAEGRRMETLLDRYLDAGEHRLRWAENGARGQGIRYLRLDVGGRRGRFWRLSEVETARRPQGWPAVRQDLCSTASTRLDLAIGATSLPMRPWMRQRPLPPTANTELLTSPWDLLKS